MFDEKFLVIIFAVVCAACASHAKTASEVSAAAGDGVRSDARSEDGDRDTAGETAGRASTSPAVSAAPAVNGAAPATPLAPALPRMPDAGTSSAAPAESGDDAGTPAAENSATGGGGAGTGVVIPGVAGAGAPAEMASCGSDMDCQTSSNGNTLFTPLCDASSNVCVGCRTEALQQEMTARVITCLTLKPLDGLSGDALVVACHRTCEL